jgi:hypothetical protein
LPFEIWFPIDYKSSDLNFIVTATVALIMVTFLAEFNVAIDCISIIFMSFTTAMLESLATDIEREEKIEKLDEYVKIHIELKNFAKDISKHLSLPFFIQTFMSAIIICTSTFLLITVSNRCI